MQILLKYTFRAFLSCKAHACKLVVCTLIISRSLQTGMLIKPYLYMFMATPKQMMTTFCKAGGMGEGSITRRVIYEREWGFDSSIAVIINQDLIRINDGDMA